MIMSSSRIVAVIVAILVILQMHACIDARNPSQFYSFTKLQDADKTKVVREIGINGGSPMFEEAKQISSGDVTSGMLGKNATGMTMEMQDDFEGKARAMQESHETKEATEANEVEPIEDTAVEDYVQIHHKSPIHNHH